MTIMMENVAVEPKRVLFFGDSITEMGVSGDGYIAKMNKRLEENKLQDKYVLIGSGIGGNKIYDLFLLMYSKVDILKLYP